MENEGVVWGDVRALDKLRHNDPKTGRLLKRAGTRLKQFALLAQREETMTMATMANDATERMNYNFTGQQRKRLLRLQGNKTRKAFVDELLDTYERRSGAVMPGEAPGLRLTRDQFERWTTLSEQRGIPLVDFPTRLMDYWERPPDPAATVTAETVNILKEQQERLGTTNQLDTMRRLSEIANSAKGDRATIKTLEQARADQDAALVNARDKVGRLEGVVNDQYARIDDLLLTRVADESDASAPKNEEQEQQIIALKTSVASSQATVDELQQALVEAMDARNALGEELRTTHQDPIGTQEALFDFVQAFTGAQAVADASGEILVSLPPARLSDMFAIWGRAVRLLGIAKRAA